MRMHAATLNPALDLSGHVREILPNEKNYVFRKRLDPGGNGINSARMAARLGSYVTLLGFLGGSPGKQIEALLRERENSGDRMRVAFTRIAKDTRINVTVTNDKDHNQTRLTFPGPEISAAELKRFRSHVSSLRGGGLFVLGGSVPASCSHEYVLKLLRVAERQGLGLVVDVPAVRLEPLLRDLRSRLLLIKPNQLELETALGIKLRSRAQLRSAALGALDRSALVCVSLGSEGALLAARGKTWIADPIRVRARGSVGAGDSMVGAMCSRLIRKKLTRPEQIDRATDATILEVFAWGMAAGAATAETEGTALGPAARVRELASRVRIRELG